MFTIFRHLAQSAVHLRRANKAVDIDRQFMPGTIRAGAMFCLRLSERRTLLGIIGPQLKNPPYILTLQYYMGATGCPLIVQYGT